MENNLKSIEELRIQNEALENSLEYQRIIPEVMKEVYTQFVNERIKEEEEFLESLKDLEDDPFFSRPINADDLPFGSPNDEMSYTDSTKAKIASAKELMPNHPEQAAEYLIKLGHCHRIWGLQKSILKERFGITWYTPAELNPDICFD